MKIKQYIKGHSGLATLILILVIVFAVVGGRAATRKQAESSLGNNKQVTLVDARTFRDDLAFVSVDGVVESASQAEIRSQVPAPISQIYVGVGDHVAQGQTLVELQNADIRAQLEQSRANLVLAQNQYRAGDVSTDATGKSVVDRIRESFVRADDIVNGQVGQFLYSGNPNQKQLQEYITDSTIGSRLSIEWSDTQEALRKWRNSVNTFSDAMTKEDVSVALSDAQKYLATVSKFLDTLSLALVNISKASAESDYNLINGWKTVVSAGRTAISSSISTFTTSGASIASSQAQITVAEAGVRALEAQLAKTIIRAPFAGTVAALPLRVGEYASPGQLLTTIVSSGALELRAYASSDDLERIKRGASVVIQGNIPGTVVSVAPSVDQATKKIEVRIQVPAREGAGLVVGQNVQAKIASAAPTTSSRTPVYILPIQNVKIIPGSAHIFTVDTDSKIVKHEVTLGEVKGDFVEVKTGITDDMKLVSPVYELEEGQIVRTE